MRRSDHLNDKILRQYQQIYTLNANAGRWEITSVREVRKPPVMPTIPKNRS